MPESAQELLAAQRRFLLSDIPPVIGHRGAALAAPENTLAGILEAKRQAARWVEVDVKLSAEGMPFLLHDDALDRTTSGVGPAGKHLLAELLQLDAGAWFAGEFTGERIPTLAQLFELLVAENMSVNLEIKPNPGEDEATASATIQIIEQLWPKSRSKPLLSSFSIPSLIRARDRAPGIPRGLLIDAPDDHTMALMGELACASLHVDAKHCTTSWLGQMAKRGIPVLCYTVNDADRAVELLNAGAHSIITDAPALIIDAILQAQ